MSYVPPRFQPSAAPLAGEGAPYVFSERLKLAIDVALAAGRPLLVSGNPGSGKTTLARAVAAGLAWRFLKRTVTSRTRLEDLQAEVDMLRRLADAQQGKTQNPDWTYLKPGILWWAFDRSSAFRRGSSPTAIDAPPLTDPSEGTSETDHVVVLLDEIDKADPDLPNDLLEPLDRRRFTLPIADLPQVRARDDLGVLLIMTTNGERDLPPAFLRRCVTLEIPDARPASLAGEGEITLEDIAASHFPPGSRVAPLFEEIAHEVQAQREEALRSGTRPPSTAEYIDTLRVLERLPDVRSPDEVWREVKSLLLTKTGRAG